MTSSEKGTARMSTHTKTLLTAVLGAVAMVAAVAAMQADAHPNGVHGSAKATLHDAAGNEVGTVRFLPQGHDKVAVRATASLLPAGFHGFHIHAVGLCEAPFTSAGGHYNPGSVGHGGHVGDMPVLFVQRNGESWAEFETDAFTIDELLDLNGSAVIVHAAADNYANIPTRYSSASGPGPGAATLSTGDAGARIACGVVERS